MKLLQPFSNAHLSSHQHTEDIYGEQVFEVTRKTISRWANRLNFSVVGRDNAWHDTEIFSTPLEAMLYIGVGHYCPCENALEVVCAQTV